MGVVCFFCKNSRLVLCVLEKRDQRKNMRDYKFKHKYCKV